MQAATVLVEQEQNLSPAVQDLLAAFIPAGSHCLNVARTPGAATLRPWLRGHGCHHAEVDPSRATLLPFENESFDAALLFGVIDQLGEPSRAVAELHRVLRPGGVLLVTATNASYWRRCLAWTARAHDPQRDGVNPGALRRLLLESGFSLVGLEGQDGAILRDLPLTGRLWRGRGSGLYRFAERFFPALLGSRVGAFAVRV